MRPCIFWGMLSDPIAALATPPGRSALAVIRLSGEGAFDVARTVVAEFEPSPPRVVRLATFRAADGSPIDHGLYTVFPAPNSYTGEDLVEFSCHGGLTAPATVLAALYAAGARAARPGEFTRRAVLNQKMDLVQAEAVGDLIDATAPAQAKAALEQMDGALSRRVGELREQLIELQALLSYDIDFPEEDDGPIPAARIVQAFDRTAGQVDLLLRTAPAGQRLREGALVVIAGPPNVGKSSLFNALLGTRRVLVSETPGTTRDTVEVFTAFNGWPIRLADTAGLFEFTDPVNRMGVDVSREYIGAADLVLLCVEQGRLPDASELELMKREHVMLVRTKSDLVARRPEGPAAGDDTAVSVVTGEGLDQLRHKAAQLLFSNHTPVANLEPALTRARHREALSQAQASLAAARPHLGRQGDAVLVSHHVRDATAALDELIGVVEVEQVLDRVFASFCVGK